ncbi:MAG: hypothetical protein QM522_04650 [Chitinophagaceae bacterium]|nr:hypothetical protein [Chitinophagaceae bacterium]
MIVIVTRTGLRNICASFILFCGLRIETGLIASRKSAFIGGESGVKAIQAPSCPRVLIKLRAAAAVLRHCFKDAFFLHCYPVPMATIFIVCAALSLRDDVGTLLYAALICRCWARLLS